LQHGALQHQVTGVGANYHCAHHDQRLYSHSTFSCHLFVF
jgi:hypothetical protein